MGEYIPTEQELADVLCRVRETDWEAAVRRSNDIWSESGCWTERNGYKDFIKNFKNLRDISQEYMGTPEQWRYYTFSFILGQIVSSPTKDQRLLLELVNRYRETARERLLDVVWREWHKAGENKKSLVKGTPEYLIAENDDQRLKDKFYHIEQDSLSELDMLDIAENSCGLWWEFLGDSERQEMTDVDEKSLVWRILVAQKLLELIDDSLRQIQQQAAVQPEDQELTAHVKKNTVLEAANLFFDKYIGDDNSIFAVLRVGKGKGKRQEELPELWDLFKKEHFEISQKEAISRDSFKTYLNNWRLKKVITEK